MRQERKDRGRLIGGNRWRLIPSLELDPVRRRTASRRQEPLHKSNRIRLKKRRFPSNRDSLCPDAEPVSASVPDAHSCCGKRILVSYFFSPSPIHATVRAEADTCSAALGDCSHSRHARGLVASARAGDIRSPPGAAAACVPERLLLSRHARGIYEGPAVHWRGGRPPPRRGGPLATKRSLPLETHAGCSVRQQSRARTQRKPASVGLGCGAWCCRCCRTAALCCRSARLAAEHQVTLDGYQPRNGAGDVLHVAGRRACQALFQHIYLSAHPSPAA